MDRQVATRIFHAPSFPRIRHVRRRLLTPPSACVLLLRVGTRPASLSARHFTSPLHDSAHVLTASDRLNRDWTLQIALQASTCFIGLVFRLSALLRCDPLHNWPVNLPSSRQLAIRCSARLTSSFISSLLFSSLPASVSSLLFSSHQFILYNDPRDAEHATRTLDGTEIRGKPVRVEISTKGPREKGSREGRGEDRGAPRSFEDRPPRSFGPGGSGGAPCYICHQPGHIAAYCPSNAPPPSRGSGAAPPYPPASYPPGGYAPPYPPRGDYRGGSAGGRRSRSRSPRRGGGGGGAGARRERSRSRSGSRSPRRDYREVRRADRPPPPAEYRRDDRPDDRRDSRDDRRGNGGDRRRDDRPPVDDRDYRGDRRGDMGGAAPPPPPVDDRPDHNDLGDLDAQA